MQTFIFCTDLHGDNQDSKTVEALFRFTDIYKPNKRIFGGDLFDFRQIRRGVSGAERQNRCWLMLRQAWNSSRRGSRISFSWGITTSDYGILRRGTMTGLCEIQPSEASEI